MEAQFVLTSKTKWWLHGIMHVCVEDDFDAESCEWEVN